MVPRLLRHDVPRARRTSAFTVTVGDGKVQAQVLAAPEDQVLREAALEAGLRAPRVEAVPGGSEKGQGPRARR